MQPLGGDTVVFVCHLEQPQIRTLYQLGCNCRCALYIICRNGLRYFTQLSRTFGQEPLQNVDKVLKQVKTIGNLDGCWCSLCRSGSIFRCTITTDDFDSRMSCQPLGQGGS